MEDDDEFGGLYRDVLRPLEKLIQPLHEEINAPVAPKKAATPLIDLNTKGDDDEIIDIAPNLKISISNSSSATVLNLNAPPVLEETLAKPRGFDLNLDSNSDAAGVDGLDGNGGDGSGFGPGVLEKGEVVEMPRNASSFVEEDDDFDITMEEGENRDEDLVEKNDIFVNEEQKMYVFVAQTEKTTNIVNGSTVDEMGPNQMNPELLGRLQNSRDLNVEDEWESEESEDDLQIVLNDGNHGQMGMKRLPGAFDEDDEDGVPLVIVADTGDVDHDHHQGQRMMDEQEWGGDVGVAGTDGEEKDLGDTGTASEGGGGAARAAVQPQVARSGGEYHHPFPSHLKYVRPGAAPLLGPAPGGIPGQVHPPVNMGLPAGPGRGDWGPAGINGSFPMQKGFHTGHGSPTWGVNAAGRGYGSGLDFTLPSQKTILGVDIDSFEEKPWKLPGRDMSDFFNFGLDEDRWRDYCKLLEQLQLGMTMKNKVCVYESGRAHQVCDPNLPPKLAAAAAGVQDNPSENANYGKVDSSPTDLGREDTLERPPLSMGRSILIEIGIGDRLPSTDTRRPRLHDIDTIIEIPCHSSKDDDDMAELQDNDLARKDLGGGDEADGLQEHDTKDVDRFSPAYNGRKREFELRRKQSKNTVRDDETVKDGELQFPPEVNVHSAPDMEIGVPHEGRVSGDDSSTKGRGDARSTMMPASENKREKHAKDDLKEESFYSGDGNQSHALSPSRSSGSGREQAIVIGDEMNDGSVMDDESFDMEREEYVVDAPNGVRCEDENTMSSKKKQKLSSLVGQLPQEYDDRQDLSKARLGSSKDCYDRDEGGTQIMVVKGREDSFSSRHWRKESDVSEETWKDEDHRGRRMRGEGPGKREHGWEISSRNQGNYRENEKSERNEHHQSRNQLDNSSWRGANHDLEIIGSRQRDWENSLKFRNERLGDLHNTRRKEKGNIRQVHVEMEDVCHNQRENTTQRKRGRDDSSDQLKIDDQAIFKDDEVHYAREKEGGLFQRDRSERQREGDQRYRIKQDEVLSRRGREETQPVMRSGRAAEEKKWRIHSKGSNDCKGSIRAYHPKDVGRQNDQLKQRDRFENEGFPKNRNHEECHARENQLSNYGKRSRYARGSSSHDARAICGFDTSRVHEYKKEESSRKSNESTIGDRRSLIPFKRNQDDGSPISQTENFRVKTKQQSGRNHVNCQLSRKHREEASTDDEHPDSKRGRSKLKHWTNHKERDSGIASLPSSNSSMPPKESSKTLEDKSRRLVDDKDTSTEVTNDNPKAAEDTVGIDSEIKSVRPPRKRRWTGN